MSPSILAGIHCIVKIDLSIAICHMLLGILECTLSQITHTIHFFQLQSKNLNYMPWHLSICDMFSHKGPCKILRQSIVQFTVKISTLSSVYYHRGQTRGEPLIRSRLYWQNGTSPTVWEPYRHCHCGLGRQKERKGKHMG